MRLAHLNACAQGAALRSVQRQQTCSTQLCGLDKVCHLPVIFASGFVCVKGMLCQPKGCVVCEAADSADIKGVLLRQQLGAIIVPGVPAYSVWGRLNLHRRNAFLCADAARGGRGFVWSPKSLEYSARSDCLVALYSSNRAPIRDKGRLVVFDMSAGGSVLCSVTDSMCDHVILAGRSSQSCLPSWQCIHVFFCKVM